MEEKVFTLKTRNFLPLIEKLVELENLSGSIFLNFQNIMDFQKYVDEKIEWMKEHKNDLNKEVKFVFRSR